MVTPKHSWIFVHPTRDGLQWPSRSGDATHLVRLAGRWSDETHFETMNGDTLVLPPPGPDGWREGPIDWLEMFEAFTDGAGV